MAYSLIDVSGATKTGSTTYTTYVAGNAFDADTGTFWWHPNWPADGGTLKVDFGAGNTETLTQTKIYHGDATNIIGNIQGSNNDSDWDTLDTFDHAAVDTWYTDEFANTTAYRYYRILFTGGSSAWVKIMEWELYETANMAISFVQYDDFRTADNVATVANDTALNTTTGNLLVVAIGSSSSTGDDAIVTGVADTEGNTYTKAIGAYRTTNTSDREEIWYAENITGNANNVTTATFTGNSDYCYISVAEFSGAATSSALLDTSSNAQYSSSHTSAVATSTSTGDLIVGGGRDTDPKDITVGGGFTTLRSDLTSVVDFAEYLVLGASGNYAATYTTSADTDSIVVCAIFAIASAAGPANVKSIKGLAIASVKSVKGLAIASVKSWNGLE